MEHSIQDRIEGALWGLFVADSLAMPIHWYYNRKNITSDFPGGGVIWGTPLTYDLLMSVASKIH